jgi:hypothetical protein
MLMLIAAAGTRAWAQPSLDTFRVFLWDGQVVVSHGEFARVGDDLVLLVPQRSRDGVQTHDLITIPVSRVDMERTVEYATALRAAQYGATRGEEEYTALTRDIARALAELEASDDKDRRLGIAQVARARLAAWSQEHFGYRAQELQQLVSLFDEVIIELQAATGVSHFSLDLMADAAPSTAVPLLAVPSPLELVEMALAAAAATDVGAERIALLQSATRALAEITDAPRALVTRVAALLKAELQIESDYRLLIANAVSRADVAVRLGLPAEVTRLITRFRAGDARLGYQRPREVSAALRRLEDEVVAARVQRSALDRWAAMKDRLQAYDVRARALVDGWLRHAQVLASIRDGRPVSPDRLEAAARRFKDLDLAMAALRPPSDLRDVHSLLRSAIQMARQGILLGQRLAVAANTEIARNASAAVAGADLLRTQALADLAAGLRPRTVR